MMSNVFLMHGPTHFHRMSIPCLCEADRDIGCEELKPGRHVRPAIVDESLQEYGKSLKDIIILQQRSRVRLEGDAEHRVVGVLCHTHALRAWPFAPRRTRVIGGGPATHF